MFIKLGDKIINTDHIISVVENFETITLTTTALSLESEAATSDYFILRREEAEAARRYFGSIATDLVEQLNQAKAREALMQKARIITEQLLAKYEDKGGLYTSNIADWIGGLIDQGKALEEITAETVASAMRL